MKRLLLVLLLCVSKPGTAQGVNPDLPFPKSKGAKGVVVKHIYHTKPLWEGDKRSDNDTSELFYFDQSGNAVTTYGFHDNERTIKQTFEYNNANLTLSRSYQNKGSKGNPFEKLNEQSLEMSSETAYTYDGKNRLITEQFKTGAAAELKQETRYSYDDMDRLVKKDYKSFGGYYKSVDSLTLRYRNDTAFGINWYPKQQSAFISITKKNAAGNITEHSSYKTNDTLYDRTFTSYNKAGQVTEEHTKSSMPLRSNGIILRANGIVYEYDKNARLRRKVFYVDTEKVWEDVYTYF